MPAHPDRGETVFRGIPVSGGVCHGKIFLLGSTSVSIVRRTIEPSDVDAEISRFEQALVETRLQVLEVQKRVLEAMGAEHAGIFDAHVLALDDPVLLDEVKRTIESERVNAEYAYKSVADRYARSLAAVDDPYLRERVADIQDVSSRVLQKLLGHEGTDGLDSLEEPCIVVAHDLAPSQTAHLDPEKVLGFATDVGSRTSHTAIMARSLEIPAVVGFENLTAALSTGEDALLDGYSGVIIINPGEQTLFEYGRLADRRRTLEKTLQETIVEPAETKDGYRVTLSGNIEVPNDTAEVIRNGAEGVGLFRTEYIFIDRDKLPTEEEQYASYRKVAAELKPAPVVIRTLDLGGDKFRSPLQVPTEMNPFLGWRAIRYCLHEKEVFRSQLRAILRASVEGNVKLMYPMISGLAELNEANALVEECKAELQREGIPFDAQMEIGAMIETPSAALVADSLGKRLKFFSIGTNDLIQYSLAVDRTNEKIAHLYEPTHPAILRLIQATVDAARRNGIWVGVCGEMAGDPVTIPLLLGLGVDELSAAPSVVPQLKYVIRSLKIEDARRLAEEALASESGADTLAKCRAFVQMTTPGLLLGRSEETGSS